MRATAALKEADRNLRKRGEGDNKGAWSGRTGSHLFHGFQSHGSTGSNRRPLELPRLWFIYLLIGAGGALTLVTTVGAIAAETNSSCCLAFYQFGLSLLLISECIAAALIQLNDVPFDPTGEFSRYCSYVRANLSAARLAVMGLMLIQSCALLLAMVLRAVQVDAGEAEEEEDEYGPGAAGSSGGGISGSSGYHHRSLHQPLLRPPHASVHPTYPGSGIAPGAGPVLGAGGGVGPGAAGGSSSSGSGGGSLAGSPSTGQMQVPLSDAWRQRLMEKYGLDTNEFGYGHTGLAQGGGNAAAAATRSTAAAVAGAPGCAVM